MFYDLYWTSANGQTDILLGEDFPDPQTCKAAIPEARRLLFSQLATNDRDGLWIDQGKFYCQAKSEPLIN